MSITPISHLPLTPPIPVFLSRANRPVTNWLWISICVCLEDGRWSEAVIWQWWEWRHRTRCVWPRWFIHGIHSQNGAGGAWRQILRGGDRGGRLLADNWRAAARVGRYSVIRIFNTCNFPWACPACYTANMLLYVFSSPNSHPVIAIKIYWTDFHHIFTIIDTC